MSSIMSKSTKNKILLTRFIKTCYPAQCETGEVLSLAYLIPCIASAVWLHPWPAHLKDSPKGGSNA